MVAMVDDEVTVKRFQLDGQMVILKPENEQFAPIGVSPPKMLDRLSGLEYAS